MRRFSSSFPFGSMPRRWYQSHTHRFFLYSKSIMPAVDKSYQHSNLLNFSCRGNTSSLFNQHYVHFSTQSNREETENDHNHQLLQVEIISKEFIKPAVPTPAHLRMHRVSLLDQLFPNVYSSFVYFYPNNDDHQNHKEDRHKILKQSLSKTLTKFYPLAGRIKDDHIHVDCNDDGVYYVEAKVEDHLSDFLKEPDNNSIHDLLPFHPNYVQLLSENYLAMVQVTEFGCGGIAIGTYTSHKIMDGYSIGTFLKAWATTARTSSSEEEIISPSFIASSIFPANPALSQDATSAFFPLFAQNKTATRRFLFRASSLATLKEKLNSSRVLAVTGLIWKRAVEASKARSKVFHCSTPESSSLAVVVSIRDRVSPPFPPNSIGNIFTATTPIQCSGDEDLGVDNIVQRLKDSTNVFNSEYLKQVTGSILSNTEAVLNMMHMPYSDKNAKHMVGSSMCRSGQYETDFGWGKPIWVSVGNGDSNFPVTENFVVLMDTRCGNGIEAWVTLREEDMDVLEHDPELLAFASLNPSPLESAVE